MTYFIELAVNGAVSGSLYALVALAFVVVYKASRIINFALGELVMFASGLVAVGLHALGLGLAGSLLFAGLGMIVIAVGFNHLVLRHLVGGRLVALIMVTIGFGAFLRAVAVLLFAGIPRSIELPLSRDPVLLGPVLLSPHELASAAIAIAVMAAVAWFFARSRTGIALRAIADDQGAAAGMGISIQWHFAITWGLAGLIAVVGGVLWTFVTGGGFSLALVGLKVLPIVIIGGLDSIAGAVVGAMLVGLLESLAAGYVDPLVGGGVSNVLAYLAVIGVLWVRPAGLFGRMQVERV